MSEDQRPDDFRSPSRRSTLQALGTLLSAGGVTGAVTAQEDDGSYRITQAGQTLTVEPLSGDRPVEELYSYRLPDQYEGVGVHDVEGGPYYESAGTQDLQRESTTITFLYDGPNGLSLVTVHGRATTADGGGSASWDVAVDAEDADWLVRDDQYWDRESGERAASNFDNWTLDGDQHRIDWTWSGEATDGGVLGYLDEASALLIDPSYNEQATLYDEHYAGDVTDWQFLSGTLDDPDRIALALDEPLGVAAPDGDPSAVDVDDTRRDDDGDGSTGTETSTETEATETGTTTDEETETTETDETEATETETDETEAETTEATETETTTPEESDEPEERGDDAEGADERDAFEEQREAIQNLREEIQERQEAIAEATGEGPDALREEIAELRARIREIREEIESDRGSFLDDG